MMYHHPFDVPLCSNRDLVASLYREGAREGVFVLDLWLGELKKSFALTIGKMQACFHRAIGA